MVVAVVATAAVKWEAAVEVVAEEVVVVAVVAAAVKGEAAIEVV